MILRGLSVVHPFFHKFCSVHGDMRIQIIHSSSEDESNPFHEDTLPSESLSDPLIRFRFALPLLSRSTHNFTFHRNIITDIPNLEGRLIPLRVVTTRV